jgi:hypothetical protein
VDRLVLLQAQYLAACLELAEPRPTYRPQKACMLGQPWCLHPHLAEVAALVETWFLFLLDRTQMQSQTV